MQFLNKWYELNLQTEAKFCSKLFKHLFFSESIKIVWKFFPSQTDFIKIASRVKNNIFVIRSFHQFSAFSSKDADVFLLSYSIDRENVKNSTNREFNIFIFLSFFFFLSFFISFFLSISYILFCFIFLWDNNFLFLTKTVLGTLIIFILKVKWPEAKFGPKMINLFKTTFSQIRTRKLKSESSRLKNRRNGKSAKKISAAEHIYNFILTCLRLHHRFTLTT